jgi:hypothetical protein
MIIQHIKSLILQQNCFNFFIKDYDEFFTITLLIMHHFCNTIYRYIHVGSLTKHLEFSYECILGIFMILLTNL